MSKYKLELCGIDDKGDYTGVNASLVVSEAELKKLEELIKVKKESKAKGK